MANMERQSLYSIKAQIEVQIAHLNKQCECSENLSLELREKIGAIFENLGTNLRNVKNGIKVGILKKIETMDLEILYAIAFSSLSILSEGINPDAFIGEYEQLKSKYKKALEDYEKGQQKELEKRKKLVSDLLFEVEGPVYVFVDSDGNPRTGLIIEDKDLERLKKQVKENPGLQTRLFNVKVPKEFFTDEQLLGIGASYKPNHIWPMSNISLVVKCFNELSEEELQDVESRKLPAPSYVIRIHNEMFRQFDYKYNCFSKPQEDKRINKMGIILPEVLKKQKLLSDTAHLKRYVQELLVGSEFLNWDLSIDENSQEFQALQQLKSLPITTFFSEEEFDEMIDKSIRKISNINLQELFSEPRNIGIYREYIKGIKREREKEIKRPYPGLWLKSETLTIEKRDAIVSKKTPFRREFKRPDGFSGEIAKPGFITEEDWQALEQNQMITKEINGIMVSFGLDYSRTKGLSQYWEERDRKGEKFYEDLKNYFNSYRTAINDYLEQMRTVELCDRQLEALKQLEQKQASPISQGSFTI